MTKQKQFTIIMKGNRFGDYLSETMDGYYTKWQVKYRYYSDYNEYHLKEVKVKGISLSESEITDQLIERTEEWYQEVHHAGIGGTPIWLRELKK